MRSLTVSLLLLGALACAPSPGPRPDNPFAGRWIDLTHAYDAQNVFWPTGKPFEHTQTAWGETSGGYSYSSYDFATSEHSGTHIDAPIHFGAGKLTVDRIPIERLAGPGVVVDVTSQSAVDADYLVSVADIEADEAAHGPIPSGAIVLARTGWSARWPDVKQYLGDDTPGRTDSLHFPGYSPEAAELLVARGVHAIGIDTASIDRGPSADFRAHQIVAAAEVPGLENLTALDQLPPRGAWIIALPMKIGGGSGGPCRVVALIPGSITAP